VTAQRERPTAATSTPPVDERNVDNVLGQQIMGDFRPSDLLGTAGALAGRTLRQPTVALRSSLGFVGELARVAAGEAHFEPVPGDRRFSDPQWTQSPLYAALLQSYLALTESMAHYAQRSAGDDRQAERTRFLLGQVTDALAPTNFLLSNPVALRQARETGGRSLLRGARNLFDDVRRRRPIPAQVDESAFEVGVNLGVTPGSVVLRTEMFELIQYAPQTAKVYSRPIVIVPSIVNKFYVFDLAPGRSIIEHFVKNGHTVFVMAWRNPQRRHDRWGMPEYQDAIDTAIDTATAIRNCADVNLWAVCGAGPVAVSLAGYYAATGQRKINSLLLVVSPLDTQAMSDAPSIGAFVDRPVEGERPVAPERVTRALHKRRMSARDFTVLFAMLRANELIWHYWVQNYLMGNSPSAFDVLYWNSDGTGMTAQFNHDFSEFVESNPFVTPGAMTVRGTAIADLADLDIDSYVLGAKNDHLCIWPGVYRSAQLLGPRSQFVLGNSGHIQTIVCPPGNAKASFSTNPDHSLTSAEWLAGSERHPGSWWDHGVAWTVERAGKLVTAPRTAGNADHPPLGPAPGTYVHERG
jgi:polyhydroxyalkanoate synthase subunit PhaC